ncbi:DUF262 domain-containing protein [Saccharothrix sp. 6-C]|uniref:DUF262 domain-containing protein n=1 Tax=Saccharothrix sp. 6-C TaxID=2781735 RepID=UPI001916E2AB|nr:DUF262 domain-containing protein [Saccharothrix sp. 6-C]QQQ77465.1 DUF262 domain-containing protein [Saccharothrix sp. 6-C]
MKKLEAHEVALAKVFSSDYEFVVPDYQRPYTWEPAQATQLLADLVEAVDRDPEDPYFLGSVVLVKRPDEPLAEVIDGQQRLTTLTILLAVLRELTEDPRDADNLDILIWEPGNTILDLDSRPRLRLRPRDEEFFRKHVQARGGVDLLHPEAKYPNDAQARIAANARALRDALASSTPAQRLALAKAVVQRTFLVMVSTSDLTSAYRIFSVMNSRGVELSPADIFKSQVIGALPDHDKARYAEKWEDLEADLGREAFADLFSHIRMVVLKYRARQQLLTEFGDHVLKGFLDEGKAAVFVDDVLEPYGSAYRDILTRDHQSLSQATEVNDWLRRLHLLDNFDWQAPALWALKTHRNDGSWLVGFLRRLDRLGAWMLVTRCNAQARGQRIAKLLQELQDGLGLGSPALDLDADERAELRAKLDGDVYRSAAVRKYVLLRLNELVSDPFVAQDVKIVTVEHVLPQSPSAGCEWREVFTESDRERWTHRLANLVLLSRTKNSAAGNLDFAAKRDKYFAGGKSPSYGLTTEVLREETWTPDVLDARQERLVGALAEHWELRVS